MKRRKSAKRPGRKRGRKKATERNSQGRNKREFLLPKEVMICLEERGGGGGGTAQVSRRGLSSFISALLSLFRKSCSKDTLPLYQRKNLTKVNSLILLYLLCVNMFLS